MGADRVEAAFSWLTPRNNSVARATD
jgi:hypothetical protein